MLKLFMNFVLLQRVQEYESSHILFDIGDLCIFYEHWIREVKGSLLSAHALRYNWRIFKCFIWYKYALLSLIKFDLPMTPTWYYTNLLPSQDSNINLLMIEIVIAMIMLDLELVEYVELIVGQIDEVQRDYARYVQTIQVQVCLFVCNIICVHVDHPICYCRLLGIWGHTPHTFQLACLVAQKCGPWHRCYPHAHPPGTIYNHYCCSILTYIQFTKIHSKRCPRPFDVWRNQMKAPLLLFELKWMVWWGK